MADSQLKAAFVLLVVFQLKHFIADFPLQRDFMLKKVLADWGFALPLASHCLVHAAMTLAICLAFNPSAWWLAVVDFVAHFIMDRIKSGPNWLGRYRDKQKASYWNALGFDQMVHHLTHIWIVWVLVTYTA